MLEHYLKVTEDQIEESQQYFQVARAEEGKQDLFQGISFIVFEN